MLLLLLSFVVAVSLGHAAWLVMNIKLPFNCLGWNPTPRSVFVHVREYCEFLILTFLWPLRLEALTQANSCSSTRNLLRQSRIKQLKWVDKKTTRFWHAINLCIIFSILLFVLCLEWKRFRHFTFAIFCPNSCLASRVVFFRQSNQCFAWDKQLDRGHCQL